MKIKNIAIENLFGYIDYHIDINDNNCFILTGPNGYGKTIILKIIKNLIDLNFYFFEEIEFDEIMITTEDNTIYIKKSEFIITEKNLNLSHPALSISFNGSFYTFPLSFNISSDLFEIINDHETINLIYEKINSIQASIKNILKNLFSNGNLIFIPDSRLELINKKKTSEKIDLINEKLRIFLNTIENKMNKLSNDLSSSLLLKIFEMKPQKINSDFFNDRLIGVNTQKEKFHKYGLMHLNENFEFPAFLLEDKFYSEQQKISILLYLDIESQKLHKFNYIINKIELFEKMINSSFTFKEIRVNKEYGFKILGSKNSEIQFGSLSSGEKHLLLLAYDLIFEASHGDLILIDEPEISFHPQWKTDILSHFNKAIELNNISQIIMTTHSPYVINSNWDITYDLYTNGKVN